ncbi:very short patch repair endonuclease [Agrococcus citreus]|uniref:very short patch repair endonuclease n=1 Tax=Agrococcus citreus TaxID=84643 RepID=UPI0031DBD572
MRSWASNEGTRRSMRSNKGRDTRPELEVRRRLHAAGFRYRVDYRLEPDLRTRADIAFPRRRVAIFIDGCFWHGCPAHATQPKSNSEYWGPKLARNVQRDQAATRGLQERGWRVLRYWEHEDPAQVVTSIRLTVE